MASLESKARPMNCGICDRSFASRRKPCCASCVRAKLYGPRLEQAAFLLHREKAHTLVEAVVRSGNDGVIAALPEDADWDVITTGIKSHGLERTQAQSQAIADRIRGTEAKVAELRQNVEDCKLLIAKQRDQNERRREGILTERSELDKHKTRATEHVQLAIRKARHRLEKVHKRTVEARGHLCTEVSYLGGLAKFTSDGEPTAFGIFCLPIPDLRHLNGLDRQLQFETCQTSSGTKLLAEPHDIISASLENVCRFLGVCCHYLSVRLPAEIILPHNDFPHAAIMAKNPSYRLDKVTYPGHASSSSASPKASRILDVNDVSRPRVLRLDRPLPQLQKEDPKAAALFLEGVTLLAYSIAWLCRSQGIDTVNTFEDICNIGGNLHHLFIGSGSTAKRRPVLNRNISTATTRTNLSVEPTSAGTQMFGTYSHGSAQNSLSSPSGLTLLNLAAWPISIPRLTDRLRAHLREETADAVWHVVDDPEWEQELERDRPVLVGGMRRSLDAKGMAMSVLSVRPSDGVDESESAGAVDKRVRSHSGWMKVRGKGGEG